MNSSIANKDVAAHLHSYTNLAQSGQVEPLVIVQGKRRYALKHKRYCAGAQAMSRPDF
jgi:hypothetical protein